jgi:hypothetical protein
MGVKIPCGLYPEVPPPGVVRAVAPPPRGGVSRPRAGQGEPHPRGASDARSCAHVDLDPAQVRGVTGDRVPQGQQRNRFGPSVRWAQAQFRGPALLGTGYFVSTVGRDEAMVRDYIRRREEEDKRLDELDLWH